MDNYIKRIDEAMSLIQSKNGEESSIQLTHEVLSDWNDLWAKYFKTYQEFLECEKQMRQSEERIHNIEYSIAFHQKNTKAF